ncbi:MAG: CBS domain-containing protein [Chloroflexi bacterium]|nr:CBS domain-containing protein [Chloroflexota bacterium]
MKVEEIMKSNVKTISPERSIVDAARYMRSFGIGCLVVVDDGGISGIITDRDLVVRAITHGHDVNRTTVGQHMTSPVTTIDAEMDVLDAAHLMAERGIRRLPVADNGRLIGIVSNSDIARAVDQALRDIVVGQAREAAPVE